MKLVKQYECTIRVYKEDSHYIVSVDLSEHSHTGTLRKIHVDESGKSQKIAGTKAVISLIERLKPRP